jgi:hypothetical protein
VGPDVRRSVVDAFNDGALDVLIATDAAGEGLNLHHRCRLVVDIELPWNPLRLEQRIGRVDRIGQQRIVHAIRLFHAHTIEHRVLEHLRLRDRRAASAFDCHQPSERAIGGVVLGDDVATSGDRILIRSSHVSTAGDEALRLQRQRCARSLAAPAKGVAWSAAKSSDSGRFVLLHRRSYLNPRGAVITDSLHAHSLACSSCNRRQQRIAIGAARNDLNRSIAPAPVAGVATLLVCRALVERRVDAIRQTLRCEPSATQVSLFDRRADDLAAVRRIALRRLDEGLSRVVASIALPFPECSRIDLVAAWPEVKR